MKWEALLSLLGDETVFHSSVLLSGRASAASTRRQLARWVASGRLIKLGRRLYSIAPPYRRAMVHPFAVANRLKPSSYVSLHSALAYFGLIPEHAPIVTSVTTGRPEVLETPLGSFSYRHVHRRLSFGYRSLNLDGGANAFLADPQWPPPNLELLNNALEQTSWAGPRLDSGNWKQAVAARLKKIDWKEAIQDVRPFLERQAEASLLSREHLLKLLEA